MLPSGPGGVRRFSLRGAQPSTPPLEAHSTRTALEREFNPAEADCGLQGTANSPSSTVTPDIVAEGAGFEPAAQGLPVHGISSAAPSAARSPLRDIPRPSAFGGLRRSTVGLRARVDIWRRGEDLNPRGTFWAPIRFRVGRLQPGSATPPHIYATRSHHRAGRSSSGQVPLQQELRPRQQGSGTGRAGHWWQPTSLRRPAGGQDSGESTAPPWTRSASCRVSEGPGVHANHG